MPVNVNHANLEATTKLPTDRPASCEQRVLSRIDADAVVTLTEKLIRASRSRPDVEEEVAGALATALEGIGASVERHYVQRDRPNLIARIQGDTPGGLLFLGHSDVVPAGEGWTGDPFVPRRVNGDIMGRGATDMKGGLAAIVAAMDAVHTVCPDVPMTLVCTVDEEINAMGVRHYVGSAPVGHFAACIVAEPTGLVTITSCRGAAILRIDVEGCSAHAGKPDGGASAILAAADVIAAVEADGERLAASPHPVLGSGTWNVGTIVGGHGTSIVPDRCTMTVDRRLLPNEEPHDVLERLLGEARIAHEARARPRVEGVKIKGAVEMTMPGFMTDPESALVSTIRAAVRGVGGTGEAATWTASCEGGFIAQHHDVPTVVLGPGDLPGQAHQPDERVAIDELILAARAYALIALRVGSQAGPVNDLAT